MSTAEDLASVGRRAIAESLGPSMGEKRGGEHDAKHGVRSGREQAFAA